MSPKIVCLLTFDYELPLGKSFVSPQESLFEPTQKILDLCERYDTRVTLFPDVCSVWFHRKFGLNKFADDFETQLRHAIAKGHDIELHLHPHWMNSIYENNEWLISTEKMYLSEMGFQDGEDSATSLIQRGVRYLNDLLRPIKSNYNCIAFRAAGLALQPDDDRLISSLLQNGIKLDVSISKGLLMITDTIKIDYSKTPANSYWFMSPNQGIEVAADEGLLEIPIGSFHSSIKNRFGFLYRRARSIKQMRGIALSRAEHQTKFSTIKSLILQNLRYLAGNPLYILSCDTKGFNLKMLLDGFQNYIKSHDGQQTVYLCMINHPKLMFDNQINMMGDFIKRTRDDYDITFVTCRQALEMITQNSLVKGVK